MTPRVLQFRPDPRQQNLQLIQRPAIIKLEQPQTQPLNPLQHGTQLQKPRIPKPLLLRPRPNREFKLPDLDINEPCFFKTGLHKLHAGAQIHADFQRGVALLRAPGVECGTWVARCGLDDAEVVHFLELDVASWFGVGVGLQKELVPVADAACHGAHVDEVEVV